MTAKYDDGKMFMRQVTDYTVSCHGSRSSVRSSSRILLAKAQLRERYVHQSLALEAEILEARKKREMLAAHHEVEMARLCVAREEEMKKRHARNAELNAIVASSSGSGSANVDIMFSMTSVPTSEPEETLKNSSMTIDTITGSSETKGESSSVIVGSVDGLESVNIDNTFAITSLPESMPTTTPMIVAGMWTHTDGVPFADGSDREVTLLIEDDAPEVQSCLDQQIEDRKQPYVIEPLPSGVMSEPPPKGINESVCGDSLTEAHRTLPEQEGHMYDQIFEEHRPMEKRVPIEECSALSVVKQTVAMTDGHFGVPVRKRTRSPTEYQMVSHPLVARSSPINGMFALGRVAGTCGSTSLRSTTEVLVICYYIDVSIMTFPDVRVATVFVKEVPIRFSQMCFHLNKGISNNRKQLRETPISGQHPGLFAGDGDPVPVQRSLGINWNTERDEFRISLNLRNRPLTQTGPLSYISYIFDPLGFVAPCLIPGDCLLRSMYGRGWNEPVNEVVQRRWIIWLQSMNLPGRIAFPRSVTPTVGKWPLRRTEDGCLVRTRDGLSLRTGIG